jgi:hypothetical protein
MEALLLILIVALILCVAWIAILAPNKSDHKKESNAPSQRVQRHRPPPPITSNPASGAPEKPKRRLYDQYNQSETHSDGSHRIQQ